ncbi:MAG TPA: TetR/AcrR family transcriptional regulator [Acidimicrobiales bacterium]|nr:TetR/AcrR family transcriptional regulator [Acidimicrobiales bacterium]
MARPSANRSTARLAAEDWVRAALDVMVEEGIGGVKIQRLCDRLGVTKGSFYWHFADLDAFLGEVARVWAEDGTHLPASLDEEPDPDRRLLESMRLFADPRNRNLARAMRDWAQNDERARAAIRRADERIFGHVKAALVRHGFDDEDAEVRAKILYYSGVGYAHVGNLGRRDTAERQLMKTWELLAL